MAYNFIIRNDSGKKISSNTDVIYGTAVETASNPGDDVIRALGGNDRVYAKFGDDIIDAGSGNDLINSGWGDDIIYFKSNSGFDTIKDFGNVAGNTDTILVKGNYNGYYVDTVTRDVALKFDYDKDGFTDGRVLLSGVSQSEWLALEDSALVADNHHSNGTLLANTQTQLAAWDNSLLIG